jgi:hypothetical protein
MLNWAAGITDQFLLVVTSPPRDERRCDSEVRWTSRRISEPLEYKPKAEKAETQPNNAFAMRAARSASMLAIKSRSKNVCPGRAQNIPVRHLRN